MVVSKVAQARKFQVTDACKDRRYQRKESQNCSRSWKRLDCGKTSQVDKFLRVQGAVDVNAMKNSRRTRGSHPQMLRTPVS